jgi:CheY-like chemotaxis protein
MAQEEKKKVLLIDDDPDDIAIEKHALEAAGFTVVTASDGREGIELAESEQPDLIITDILMPEQDGLTTFEELQKHSELQSVPVVVCTSASDRLGFTFSEEDMAAYYGKKPAAYITKPVDASSLKEIVGNILGS